MPPRAKSPAPQRRASSPAPQRQGSVMMPTLENWKWTAGNTVTGNVYGKPGTPDGTQMMTSAVPPEGKLGTHVVRVLPQSALAVATAVAAGCCGWLLRVWPPARVAACERAADARRRIVQVTESGSSYLLGKPEHVSGNRGGDLTTGMALKLLQKEAGVGCCNIVMIELFSALLVVFTLTFSLWLDILVMTITGSTLAGRVLGYTLIKTESLKPWRSCFGYAVYLWLKRLCTFIPCLVFPGCFCGCGNQYQSFVDELFGVMWVSHIEYKLYIQNNKKRIIDWDDEEKQEVLDEEKKKKTSILQVLGGVFLFLLVLSAIGSAANPKVPTQPTRR